MVEMFTNMFMEQRRKSMAQQTIAVEIIEKKVRAYQEATFLATGSLPTEIAFCDACIQILLVDMSSSVPQKLLFANDEYKGMKVFENAPMQECAVHGSKHP